MIEFSIPGFYSKHKLNSFLLDLMKEEPEKFYEDVKITSCYDSFPCIWNGGRFVNGTFMAWEVIDIIKFYNERDISLRYTFTNKLINENMLNDTIGNNLLKLTKYNGKIKNGVNTNSDLMHNYLEKNYPEFYLMWSTTKGVKDIEELNNLSKDSLIVPNYEINSDFETLSKLEHPENIELLVSEACIDNCPNRSKHYELISNSQIGNIGDNFSCPFGSEKYRYYRDMINRSHHISIEDIREKYLPLGINKFKITGRNDTDVNLCENYVNYLVKPEYRNDIRMVILNFLFETKDN